MSERIEIGRERERERVREREREREREGRQKGRGRECIYIRTTRAHTHTQVRYLIWQRYMQLAVLTEVSAFIAFLQMIVIYEQASNTLLTRKRARARKREARGREREGGREGERAGGRAGREGTENQPIKQAKQLLIDL